ncbi:MAG TPA: hypothetical protein VGC88_03055 [Terriglobales bacterium]|jgi:hypothetical protein
MADVPQRETLEYTPPRNIWWAMVAFCGVSPPPPGKEKQAIAMIVGSLVAFFAVCAGVAALVWWAVR